MTGPSFLFFGNQNMVTLPYVISNMAKPSLTLKMNYLGMSELILCVIYIDRAQELLGSFLVVNELSFRNYTGIQYFVPKQRNLLLHTIFKVFSEKQTFVDYLCLKSPYRIRLGKPFLQILIPSNTPLHLSWWMTRWCSIIPTSQVEPHCL